MKLYEVKKEIVTQLSRIWDKRLNCKRTIRYSNHREKNYELIPKNNFG